MPVRPGFGRLIASGPLQLPQIARLTAPPASTPLRDFYLPRDQSVQQDLPPAKPAFRIRPISSRSPQPVSITRSLGCGSPFLVRYVSGGLLFLKPLGTSPNMPSHWFFVNSFCGFKLLFPQDLFPLFRIGYSEVDVHLLWINRSLTLLFL
jgi:hypothetical protein